MGQHAPYWAPRSFSRGNSFDPTAAELVWEKRYGHRELIGNEGQPSAAGELGEVNKRNALQFAEHAGVSAVGMVVQVEGGFKPETVQLAPNMQVEVAA